MLHGARDGQVSARGEMCACGHSAICVFVCVCGSMQGVYDVCA